MIQLGLVLQKFILSWILRVGNAISQILVHNEQVMELFVQLSIFSNARNAAGHPCLLFYQVSNGFSQISLKPRKVWKMPFELFVPFLPQFS